MSDEDDTAAEDWVGRIAGSGCASGVTVAVAESLTAGHLSELLGADVAVGITGVGGPGSEEGKPAGTAHLAVSDHRGTRSREVRLDDA